MSIGMRIVNGLLVTLLAVAATAAAQGQSCPECDEDGEPVNNTYYSIDLGVLANETHVLGDTDAALSHTDYEKGFWAWFSLCLSAFVDGIEALIGVNVDADANVEAYLSEDGADLDATVYVPGEACAALPPEAAEARGALGDDGDCAFGYDRSGLGDLDGETWPAMTEVNAVRDETGTDGLYGDLGVGGEDLPEDRDVDLCLNADLHLGLCG